MVNGVASIPIAISASRLEPAPGSSIRSGRLSGSYVIGPENQCLDSALQPLLWGQCQAANPLFLFGRSQVGKTHLALGIAHRWRQLFDRHDVQYVTATEFCREWVTACRADSVSKFRNRYRRVRLLVIEDVDRFPSRGKCQVECVHTIDAVHERRGMVVVTSRVDPRHVLTWIPPLRSRLRGGLVVHIKPPAYTTRLALIQQAAWDRQVALSTAQMALLAGSAEPPADVMASVPRLSGPGDEAAGRQTRIRSGSPDGAVPEMKTIVSATAAFYAVKPAELKSKARRKTLVLARSVAMYLARQWTAESFQQIGRFFGHRDHSTVLHSYRKIERLLRTDEQTQHDLNAIRGTIEQIMNCG